MQTVNIRVFGVVQGVFFRQSAKIEADKLGLAGWIRNSNNGSVETLVQGTKEKLEEFIKWSKKGPPDARVERVIENPKEHHERYSSFEILR